MKTLYFTSLTGSVFSARVDVAGTSVPLFADA
jgi:hypothetical protein